jgi:hypothetical protein
MTRRTLRPGVTLSTPEISAAETAAIREQITDAVLRAHRGDVDVADVLAAALRGAAAKLGGEHELTVHRSGSWEAEHVRALAGGWEYLT